MTKEHIQEIANNTVEEYFGSNIKIGEAFRRAVYSWEQRMEA